MQKRRKLASILAGLAIATTLSGCNKNDNKKSIELNNHPKIEEQDPYELANIIKKINKLDSYHVNLTDDGLLIKELRHDENPPYELFKRFFELVAEEQIIADYECNYYNISFDFLKQFEKIELSIVISNETSHEAIKKIIQDIPKIEGIYGFMLNATESCYEQDYKDLLNAIGHNNGGFSLFCVDGTINISEVFKNINEDTLFTYAVIFSNQEYNYLENVNAKSLTLDLNVTSPGYKTRVSDKVEYLTVMDIYLTQNGPKKDNAFYNVILDVTDNSNLVYYEANLQGPTVISNNFSSDVIEFITVTSGDVGKTMLNDGFLNINKGALIVLESGIIITVDGDIVKIETPQESKTFSKSLDKEITATPISYNEKLNLVRKKEIKYV